jgi:hypothetical protein
VAVRVERPAGTKPTNESHDEEGAEEQLVQPHVDVVDLNEYMM